MGIKTHVKLGLSVLALVIKTRLLVLEELTRQHLTV